MNDQKVALVSGGNRGLGLQTCKSLAKAGFHVYLGARSTETGIAAIENCDLDNIEVVKLDVCSSNDRSNLAHKIEKAHGRLDVLVNNAGILIDAKLGNDASITDTTEEILTRSFSTNTVAPVMLINAMLNLLKQSTDARVINISSGMGQLSDMGGHYAGYRISKTALNAVTGIFAAEMDATQFRINSVCPGWVKTDMGGESADLSVEQGVDTAVWLATSSEATGTGGYYRNRELIEW